MRSRRPRDWNSASTSQKLAAFAGLAFLHFPVLDHHAVCVHYRRSHLRSSRRLGLTLHWFSVAFAREDIWAALRLSVSVAAAATLLALFLGIAGGVRAGAGAIRRQERDHAAVRAADRAARHHHRHRPAVSDAPREMPAGFWTIVAGHATFCLVIVHNNVIARLRRLPKNWIEASMDLGADGGQTFRYVLLPQIATALLAGGMLAFALSFDEIIVTLFTAGHEQHAADLVLQRAVPAARTPDHQRGRCCGHRRDAGADPAGVLFHLTQSPDSKRFVCGVRRHATSFSTRLPCKRSC